MGVLLCAGCETERPPAFHAASGGAASSTGGTVGDDGDPCARPAPSACGSETIPLPIDKPAVHFLLDYSGSMEGAPRDAVIDSLEVVLRNTGHRIRYGLSIFPHNFSSSQEVLETVDVGEDYVGPFECGRPNGPVLDELLAALRGLEPEGDTPLGGALADLPPRLTSVEGRRIVVVMTDGEPTQEGICGGSACDPETYALDGATKLLGLGIQTYVVGVAGYGSGFLAQLATAGGTADTTPSPGYYQAATAAELATVLQTIGNAARGCRIDLTEAPEDENLVNVFLDGNVVARGGDDGWEFDSASTIVLSGPSCTEILEGHANELTVNQGCPTVIK